MGFLERLFGRKKPEPTETPAPAPAPENGLTGYKLEEIRRITRRLEEIQQVMNEENKAQYTEEIRSLLQHEIEILGGDSSGKDG